jgi:hypothetical protein
MRAKYNEQLNVKITKMHLLMLENLKLKHKTNISQIIRDSIEFYFSYLNIKK